MFSWWLLMFSLYLWIIVSIWIGVGNHSKTYTKRLGLPLLWCLSQLSEGHPVTFRRLQSQSWDWIDLASSSEASEASIWRVSLRKPQPIWSVVSPWELDPAQRKMENSEDHGLHGLMNYIRCKNQIYINSYQIHIPNSCFNSYINPKQFAAISPKCHENVTTHVPFRSWRFPSLPFHSARPRQSCMDRSHQPARPSWGFWGFSGPFPFDFCWMDPKIQKFLRS